jgi:hypothetical protein
MRFGSKKSELLLDLDARENKHSSAKDGNPIPDTDAPHTQHGVNNENERNSDTR